MTCNSERLRRGRVLISVAVVPAIVFSLIWLVVQRQPLTPAQVIGNDQPIQHLVHHVSFELTLGVNDERPTDWDGAIMVRPGKVVALRNVVTGELLEEQKWQSRSQRRQGTKKKQLAEFPLILPVRLLLEIDAPADAQIEVSTQNGSFSFTLATIQLNHPTNFLGGAVSLVRVPNFRQLTRQATHDDFPATAVATNGVVWCAYVAYHSGIPIDESATAAGRFESLRTRGHGDQIRLMKYDDGQWSGAVNVTEPGLDVWRPSVAVDTRGHVWVLWAQHTNGNWDIYARSLDTQRMIFGQTQRLTDDPDADIHVVAASAAQQGIWLAWQSRRDGNFDIRIGKLSERGRLESEQRVSVSSANDWHPAIATSDRGDVWVAWDTYDKGDYDVYLRRMRGAQLDDPIAVANSTRFEARPSLVVDAQHRPWIAFEDADSNWGKDYGPRLTGKGVPFYHERKILVRCLDGDRLRQTKSPPPSPLIKTEFDDKLNYEPVFKQRISMPRLCFDGSGNLWLLYRRHPNPNNPGGERWVSFAQYCDGNAWSGEIALRNSDNLLDNRPAMAPLAHGGLVVVYSTDGRTSGSRTADVNNLNAAVLTIDQRPSAPELEDVKSNGGGPPVASIDPNEAEHVRRCREYRIHAGGKTYQLLRGEFHRHTEISAHRDWDGPLEEVWRYGLDVAAMDWIGPGDHDYGVGHEYMWWLTQKQIDLYYAPKQFLSMYTYERSVGYPSGHRNVMFAERGIRHLPHLPGRNNTFGTPEEGSPDIHNLYQYLRYFDGICSSHTSATNMGTDWRNRDPEVEPVVEIFQGHRQNYEEPNAPLAATGPQDTIQGYRPAGFVWEAFKKGIRLGFQSSSDHVSTHTSYAIVLAEQPTREGLLEAFKKRHCYAANDNIVMDIRCGDHIMGDEFNWSTPPALDVHLVGTASIARVDIVRQYERESPTYVYNVRPKSRESKFRWTDTAAKPGVNMYYVRLQQADNRLAWASPMWVHYQP